MNTRMPPSFSRTPASETTKKPEDSADYDRFCRFLQKHSGITLGPNRGYLVKNRLANIMKELQLSSLGQLVSELEKPGAKKLQVRVVDAMTTNETLWFRDGHPFEILKNLILKQHTDSGSGALRIWSAASSTGQEPYSISMAVSEFIERNPAKSRCQVEITATDISPTVLQQAGQGVYDKLELGRGLSPQRLQKFFQPVDGLMQVKDDIRRRVRYRELNLLGSYSTVGKVDVVFCRNVLIYFTHENKCEILSKIVRVLKPKGYLFLGASEPIVNYSDAFDLIRSDGGVVYQLKS